MKSLFVKTLVCFTLMSLLPRLASASIIESGQCKIENLSADRYVITLTNNEVTTFTVMDESGNALVKETFSGDFRKVLNLAYLPVGEYTFFFENTSSKLSQPFNVYSKEVEFGAQHIFHYPVISKENEILNVNMEHAFNGKRARVYIRNNVNDVDFEHALEIPKNYAFNLEKLPAGEYEVAVLCEDKVYSKTIIK